MRKKAMAMVLMAIMVFACLTGCGNKETPISEAPATDESAAPESTPAEESQGEKNQQDTEDIKLAYACWNLSNEWFISLVDGFKAACDELGCEAVITNSQYKLENQINDIENLVNSGVNAIAFSAVDQTATADIVESAKAQGIIIGSTAQYQENGNYAFALNEYDYGYVIGKNAAVWVNEQLKGEGTCVILSKDNTDATIARGDGIQDALEEACPNLEIVARQAADTADTAYNIVDSVLQTTPGLNLVVGTEDSCVIGGYRAMIANNAVGDDRACFSGDAVSEVLAAMKEEDSIYRGSVDLIPYTCGYETAKAMYDMVVNGAPEECKYEWFEPFAFTKEDYLDGKYVPRG